MSCQTNAATISNRIGIKCGISTLASKSSYLTGVLAVSSGVVTGSLVYYRQKLAELSLNKTVAEALSNIHLGAEAAFGATVKMTNDFNGARRYLDQANELIKDLPRGSAYGEVVYNELSDMIAQLKSGMDLFEQGQVAQNDIVQAHLQGRVSRIFMDGQQARLGLFFARPSLAARDAALAGGATALTVTGLIWFLRSASRWQSRRRNKALVTWLPERPVGSEAEAASQVEPGRKIKVRYRVVDLNEPLASHTVTGDNNSAFDQTLQPRRRERVASLAQIKRIATRLDAQTLLRPEASWAEGPPLIGPDGLVESGNGRLLALRLAAEHYPERYRAYRKQLIQRAGDFGLVRGQIEPMNQPVLVRERLTRFSPEERLRFITEANASGLARLGVAEQAQADARLIPPGFLADLKIAGSERSLAEVLTKQANSPVIARFVKRLPETEQAALMDRTGQLSMEGLDRLERAMFAYALPGPSGERLTRLVFEEGEAIDRVGAGLKQALPKLGQLEDLVRAGQRDGQFSLGPDLAMVATKMRDLRRQRLGVTDYIRQSKMFEELTPLQEQWLVQLDRRRRSGRAVANLIKAYAEAVLETAPPSQRPMFGVAFKTEPEKLLRAALKQVGGHWIELREDTPARPANRAVV